MILINTTKTKSLVIIAIFTAIIFLLAFTPIGFIQLVVIKATIIHVPVIIGSILLGPKRGAMLGAIFGLTSLISNTATPAISSFVFSPFIPLPGESHGSILALIICFLPRILTGVVPYYVFKLFKNDATKKSLIPYAISGIAGSLTNTFLVMGGILFLFKEAYAKINQVNTTGLYKFIATIIFTNGLIEAIIAGVIVAAVCRALMTNKKVTKTIGNLEK